MLSLINLYVLLINPNGADECGMVEDRSCGYSSLSNIGQPSFENITVQNGSECCQRCSNNARCRSFNWIPSSGDCLLYTGQCEERRTYILVKNGMLRDKAQTHCQSQCGTNLATVITNEEVSLLQEMARNASMTAWDFYIGLNDIDTEGTWVWQSGRKCDYVRSDELCINDGHWMPGEPSNNGDCGVFSSSLFKAGVCSADHRFFCDSPPIFGGHSKTNNPTINPTLTSMIPSITPTNNPSAVPTLFTYSPTETSNNPSFHPTKNPTTPSPTLIVDGHIVSPTYLEQEMNDDYISTQEEHIAEIKNDTVRNGFVSTILIVVGVVCVLSIGILYIVFKKWRNKKGEYNKDTYQLKMAQIESKINAYVPPNMESNTTKGNDKDIGKVYVSNERDMDVVKEINKTVMGGSVEIKQQSVTNGNISIVDDEFSDDSEDDGNTVGETEY